MVMLTHKLRMTVRTKRQREALSRALDVSRLLYNAGLEERSGAWTKLGEPLAQLCQVIRVKPHHSSNCCSVCQRLTHSRIGDEFRCAHCGHTMDRDHNAALNILARGVVIPVAQGAWLPGP